MRPFLTVWGAWLLVMAGANLATALYALYARQFHFSSLVLTTIFATYAVVLVPALILFGRLSDRLGRRVVVVLGLSAAIAGLAVFAVAQNALWLYVARGLQGLAVGMISGAATAALVELDPDADRRRASLFAGLAQAGGSAAGPLLAGVLVQWAPAPRQLSYLVVLAATIAAAALVARLPEPPAGARETWRIQVPRVPRELLGSFIRVSVTAGVVWATLALFLSVVPTYAGDLLDTRNVALLSTVAALSVVASCVAQIAARTLVAAGRPPQAVGLGVLAVGLGFLVAASPAHSLTLLALGSLAAGAGHGLAFINAQQELNELAPAERRGEVTAAFVACIYFLVASSVIGVGLVDRLVSLAVALALVAAVLVVAALATSLWQLKPTT
ncbi:MAG TPA: MFS transporter [Gaiellaceae bacterium]|nr:MFS transporter [Gaiellaceae bacterium]